MSDETRDDEHTCTHQVVLDFDTDDPEFSRGFEAGTVWTLLRDPEYDSVDAVVRASLAEMMIRMGEATHRSFRADPVEGTDYLHVYFGPVVRQEAPQQ